MANYIDGVVIKKSVEQLKESSVKATPFLLYLILIRYYLLSGKPPELPINGSALIPATREAALVDESNEDAAYFNPFDGSYKKKRWGETNGPSDSIKNWSSRDGGRDIVERLPEHQVITVKLLPFDPDAVQSLLDIKDAGRPDIVDVAVWWYRDKDVTALLDPDGVLTAESLMSAFKDQLDLTDDQIATLFADRSNYDEEFELDTNDNKADPASYLPIFHPRNQNTSTYEMKSYDAGSCQQLIEAVNKSGFIFSPEQVATYLTAVRTKPFVILAGVSGTGKTHLPITLAESTNSRYTICSVNPDWTDSSPLLGYTDIQNNFHPGMLLKYAKEAMANPDCEYFFLLDEMNLARVEYYFSDILSKMETMEVNKVTNRLESKPLLPNANTEYRNVVIPSNLCFVGSINMDESTHTISKKVLDRAFVLDFNEVDLTIAAVPSTEGIPKLQWTSAEWGADRKPLFGTLGLEVDEFDKITQKLNDINQVLRAGGFNFGYRLRNEICAFVYNSKSIDGFFSDHNTSSSALDIALKTKVLSRIEGQGIIINEVIKDLRECLTNDRGDVLPDSKTGFQRTLGKLSDMSSMFNHTGYTSYWG